MTAGSSSEADGSSGDQPNPHDSYEDAFFLHLLSASHVVGGERDAARLLALGRQGSSSADHPCCSFPVVLDIRTTVLIRSGFRLLASEEHFKPV